MQEIYRRSIYSCIILSVHVIVILDDISMDKGNDISKWRKNNYDK